MRQLRYSIVLTIWYSCRNHFLELAHNWADFHHTKRHFELMARYVIPHFQKKNDLRHTSYSYSHENRDVFVGAAQQAVQKEIDKLEEKTDAAE